MMIGSLISVLNLSFISNILGGINTMNAFETKSTVVKKKANHCGWNSQLFEN